VGEGWKWDDEEDWKGTNKNKQQGSTATTKGTFSPSSTPSFAESPASCTAPIIVIRSFQGIVVVETGERIRLGTFFFPAERG